MTNEDVKKTLLRSVDALQRLYAILLVLSANELFKRFAERPASTGPVTIHWEMLLDVLTFIITLVPVYHGMHRHLDKTYGAPASGRTQVVLRIFFPVDLILTWTAFSLIFGMQLTAGRKEFAWCVVALATVQSCWGYVAVVLQERGYVWFVLNAATLLISLLVASKVDELWVRQSAIAGIAIIRTVLDYGLNWHVYFKPAPPEPARRPPGL